VTLVKVARFDRDKRWLGAIDAVAELRRRGVDARFLFRGSASPYRDEVLAHLARRRLSTTRLRPEGEPTMRTFAASLAALREDAAFLDFFVPERVLRALYATADGVLANSEREPFGLVGLEVMATGGVAYVGTTGEDYAQPLGNAVVVRTDDPAEVADAALYLRARPELEKRIRTEGRQTAKRFAWPRVLDDLELVVSYAFERATSGVAARR
jgi:glycosyltransferase involved in cell wall biosynthesis